MNAGNLEVGSDEWLRQYAESERIDRIAQDATEAAWRKVNHRIISFDSFEKAVKPEILTAIQESRLHETCGDSKPARYATPIGVTETLAHLSR